MNEAEAGRVIGEKLVQVKRTVPEGAANDSAEMGVGCIRAVISFLLSIDTEPTVAPANHAKYLPMKTFKP